MTSTTHPASAVPAVPRSTRLRALAAGIISGAAGAISACVTGLVVLTGFVVVTADSPPTLAAWILAAAAAAADGIATICIVFRVFTGRWPWAGPPAPTDHRAEVASFLARFRSAVDAGAAPEGTLLYIDEVAELLGGSDTTAAGMRSDLARILLLGRSQGVHVLVDEGRPQ